MEGSSDAQAAATEDIEKAKVRKRKHNDACQRYRDKQKLKVERLENLVPKLLSENENKTRELEEMKSKMLDLEKENMELRLLNKQAAYGEQMMKQIPAGWKFNGKNISSFEHCAELILSQHYDQQVCQGLASTDITASNAGPSSHANPDITTPLPAPNNILFSPDLAASNITGSSHSLLNLLIQNQHMILGILSNTGAGFSFDANHSFPVLDADAPSNHHNSGMITCDIGDGIPNDPGAGSSSGAKYDKPVLDHDDIALLYCDRDDCFHNSGSLV